MVLSPKSRKIPTVAKLLYWFQAKLDSGKIVTHWFVMEGEFEDPDNWLPPWLGEEVLSSTNLEFHSWEFSAENKWAQRQDCAGDGTILGTPDEDRPWIVTVTRETP